MYNIFIVLLISFNYVIDFLIIQPIMIFNSNIIVHLLLFLYTKILFFLILNKKNMNQILKIIPSLNDHMELIMELKVYKNIEIFHNKRIS
jgi:hypothetical protein